jgi:hypothetical protein
VREGRNTSGQWLQRTVGELMARWLPQNILWELSLFLAIFQLMLPTVYL